MFQGEFPRPDRADDGVEDHVDRHARDAERVQVGDLGGFAEEAAEAFLGLQGGLRQA